MKEHLALIEKGHDASTLVKDRDSRTAPISKVFLLNLALLLMGIGLVIILDPLLETLGFDKDMAWPTTMFFMTGIGLLIRFIITKRLEKEA